MAELPTYMQQTRQGLLRNWILSEMLRGAGYAALLFLGVLAFIYALVVLSWALPENPYAALDVAAVVMPA